MWVELTRRDGLLNKSRYCGQRKPFETYNFYAKKYVNTYILYAFVIF